MNCKFWLFNVPDARAEFQDGTSFDGRQIGQDFVLFHAVQLVGILTEHHGFDAGFILLPIGQHGLTDITWNKWTTTIKNIFKRDNRKQFGLTVAHFVDGEDPVRRGVDVMKHFQCLWTSRGSSAGSYARRKSTLRAQRNYNRTRKRSTAPCFSRDTIRLAFDFQSGLTPTIF